MIEKIDKAIEELIAKVRQADRDSGEAMRFSQAIEHLANARASLASFYKPDTRNKL